MRETFSLFSKLIKEGKLNSFEEKKAFMLGQLKSWCDEKVFAEFEKLIA